MLKNHFGTRRGFIETMRCRILYRIGRYDDYKHIDLKKNQRLVFICKGNICRSAFAEAVARKAGIETTSYGIDTVNGKSANELAIRVAASKGYDLTGHKTKSIKSIEPKQGDLIVVMEPAQLKFFKDKSYDAGALTLMGLWSSPVSPYIQDPFGTNIEYFKNCFDYIEKSVVAVAREIKIAKTMQS